MTILEVMLSLGIIAVALSTLLGFQGGLQTSRVMAQERVFAQSLTRQIIERLIASDSSAIGDPAQMPWSVARYADGGVVGNHSPMVVGIPATNAEDSLLKSGFITKVPGITDIQVYLEYYAGSKGSEAGIPGALDDPALATATDPTQWRTQLRDATFRAKYRLDPTIPPAEQLEENDSFIIRVAVAWTDQWGKPQSTDIYTAKRVEPTE